MMARLWWAVLVKTLTEKAAAGGEAGTVACRLGKLQSRVPMEKLAQPTCVAQSAVSLEPYPTVLLPSLAKPVDLMCACRCPQCRRMPKQM